MTDPEQARGWLARKVLPGGEEPDPRFTLANERTFLAWIRTSLAFLAGGLALEAFAIEAFPEPLRNSAGRTPGGDRDADQCRRRGALGLHRVEHAARKTPATAPHRPAPWPWRGRYRSGGDHPDSAQLMPRTPAAHRTRIPGCSPNAQCSPGAGPRWPSLPPRWFSCAGCRITVVGILVLRGVAGTIAAGIYATQRGRYSARVPGIAGGTVPFGRGRHFLDQRFGPADGDPGPGHPAHWLTPRSRSVHLYRRTVHASVRSRIRERRRPGRPIRGGRACGSAGCYSAS